MKPEPVVKSLGTKVKSIAREACDYLIELLCCCFNKKRKNLFSSKVDKIAKMDREVHKGLETVRDHLDVESVIKLNQRVRALERLILDGDEVKIQKQKKLLLLNLYNSLTSGSEKHHLLEKSYKNAKLELMLKTKLDV